MAINALADRNRWLLEVYGGRISGGGWSATSRSNRSFLRWFFAILRRVMPSDGLRNVFFVRDASSLFRVGWLSVIASEYAGGVLLAGD